MLKSNNFISLSQSAPESFTVIENYLIGNYKEFQTQLHNIQRALKFDMYFGEHCKTKIFQQIRLKALQQHVMAYKVIDIKEIANDFQETVEVIENDLIQLIKWGKLNYKIDSFNKTLHKR